MKQLLYLPLAILFCILATRCSDEAATRRLAMLDAAERLLSDNADSASLLLAGIPTPKN